MASRQDNLLHGGGGSSFVGAAVLPEPMTPRTSNWIDVGSFPLGWALVVLPRVLCVCSNKTLLPMLPAVCPLPRPPSPLSPPPRQCRGLQWDPPPWPRAHPPPTRPRRVPCPPTPPAPPSRQRALASSLSSSESGVYKWWWPSVLSLAGGQDVGLWGSVMLPSPLCLCRNIVSTVDLGCKLDLKRIALHARNAEYNPKVSNTPQFILCL